MSFFGDLSRYEIKVDVNPQTHKGFITATPKDPLMLSDFIMGQVRALHLKIAENEHRAVLDQLETEQLMKLRKEIDECVLRRMSPWA